MDVTKAVQTAKEYLTDLYSDEQIVNVGLEEVEYIEVSDTWDVTLGFSRPWDHKNPVTASLTGARPDRSYKVITISDLDSTVLSLKDRILDTPQAV